MTTIIADQLVFRPPLPEVFGAKDYVDQRDLMIRIDDLLIANGMDLKFQKICLQEFDKWFDQENHTEKKVEDEENWIPNYNPYTTSGKVKQSWLNHCKVGLRTNIYRYLYPTSNRDLSFKLADSATLRWFCHVGEFGPVKPPSKSTVNRYENWVNSDAVFQIVKGIIQQAAGFDAEDRDNPFDLKETISLVDAWLDGTCLKANIHFPVDWVLFRDICRTLMKATILIRKRGLKNRMPMEPEMFLRDMNKLVIKMTQCRRKNGAKKLRKAVIREMTKLENKIVEHARKHRKVLEQRWRETDLSEAQAMQIIERIDHVIIQVPAAINQVRERIIGERRVAAGDKILSLYEPDINILVRGKADAEVEFGNCLRLTEQSDGIIIDFKLYKDPVADNSEAPFRDNVESLNDITNGSLKNLYTDRGMDSEANVAILKEFGIENGICPKSPEKLREKMSDSDYANAQRRRGSTEARIGIYKNKCLGGKLRSKGFDNRKRSVAWAVLAHNLWVIARLPCKEAGQETESQVELPQAA
jgi:IS5 family transposase